MNLLVSFVVVYGVYNITYLSRIEKLHLLLLPKKGEDILENEFCVMNHISYEDIQQFHLDDDSLDFITNRTNLVDLNNVSESKLADSDDILDFSTNETHPTGLDNVLDGNSSNTSITVCMNALNPIYEILIFINCLHLFTTAKSIV